MVKHRFQKSVDLWHRKYNFFLSLRNVSSTFRELCLITRAYANAISRSSWHFWYPMSTMSDRKWLWLNIKRIDMKESLANSKSTHFEVLETMVSKACLPFYHVEKVDRRRPCHKWRGPPWFPPKGQLGSEARGECFAPCFALVSLLYGATQRKPGWRFTAGCK